LGDVADLFAPAAKPICQRKSKLGTWT